MRRFMAVFTKEFRQIRRDWPSLGLLIFVPAMLLVMYGYALSFDVKHIRVAVRDLDRTPMSRRFQDSLFRNPYFSRQQSFLRLEDADGLLNRGRVRVVLTIPSGFDAALARGDEAVVQAMVDGADANAAGTAIGYLEALAAQETYRLRRDVLQRIVLRTEIPSVHVEARVWFNPELKSASFLVPGLIAILIMLAAVIATSQSIVREKERQTIEQLRVSPLRPWELIMGKTLPYVIICLFTTVIVLLLGYILFGVEIHGSFVVLAGTTLVFLAAALSMGVLISAATDSQQVAFQVAVLASMLPSIILSGFIFPINNMPPPIQWITLLVVPRYYVSSLRAIVLKGASWDAVWSDLAAMAALGLVFNMLAIIRMRKAT
jgi:ABC-2 type transport system permease protein